MRLLADELVWKKLGDTWLLYSGPRTGNYPLAAAYGQSIAYNTSKETLSMKSDRVDVPTDPEELEEFLELWKTLIVLQWEG